ncbi:MAG: molybdenum cofactor guanylyltransferase [bacterium]|nr:molybdenum cofactor guanylyltransferase [bacterium]
MPPIPCSAIILAGGRATRLGGVDKALISLAGRPLIVHVLERLAPQVDDILINCNRNQTVLTRLGYPLISDEKPDYSGPLAGIISALPSCRHETVLVVPCDSPFLPNDLHSRLSALLTPDKDLVIAHDGERLQPLFMLLRRKLLPSLRDYLEQGHYRVGQWCMQQKVAIARFAEPRHFINLNTPEDLKKAESGI